MSHKSKLTKTSKKPIKNQMGTVRIISGAWRGRKLPVPDLQGLRPTTDRVKETVFNWLSPYIVESHCSDLFTGSGSLSFEALSRGAAEVTMVELDNKVASVLSANLNRVKTERGQVHKRSAQSYLAQTSQGFDIIFIDPPFRQALLSPILEQLSTGNALNANALIYIEREKELNCHIPENWQKLKSKTAGQVTFELYQVTS